MEMVYRCRHFILLALFCLTDSCTTRGPKDADDVVLKSNSIKFSQTEVKDDASFAALTIDEGLFQVEAAKLAPRHAHTDDVMQLAQLMLEDHKSTSKELRRIANAHNISFPVSLGSANQRALNSLKQKNGHNFDKEYTTIMVRKHQAMIDAFTKESEIGNDEQLKKWAADKIIVLQMDLEMSARAKAVVDKQ
jgi:putative membrane protein